VSILREVSSTKEDSTLLASQYEELRCNNFPIMTRLANLILQLGGEEIPHAGLSILADHAEEEGLLLYTSYTAPMLLPSKGALKNPAVFVKKTISPNASNNAFLVLPQSQKHL